MNKTSRTRRGFLKTAGLAPATWRLPTSSGLTSADTQQEEDLRLWYRQPAADWNEALPIGNGRLGAMIFGGVAVEHLQLNDNTLYSDEPGRRDLDLDVTRDFERVVRMLGDGKYSAAGEFITRHWLGRAQPCYQPLGDLHLDFQPAGEVSHYVRELDVATAVCTVKYQQGETRFTREFFASFPDQVIVVRLASSVPHGSTLRATLSSVHPTAKTAAGGANEIVMSGQAPGFALRRTLEWVEQRGDQFKYPEVWDKNGKRLPHANTVLYGKDIGGLGTFFEVRIRAISKDGQVTAGPDGLNIRNASEVLLILSAATSYNGFNKSPSRDGVNPAVRAADHLASASRKSFATLREAHLADYKRLFDRVRLDVGKPTDQSRLPTDERIEKFANGGDASLAALYFQFGRYLMIAGSRPGGQPLNLQGIWNPHVIPPWASAYTTNINVEMNYWPAEVTNLSECHQPLLRMIEELAVNGGQVAKKMYGRRGWVVHHNTTLWRDAQPVDNTAMPSFWPMASGWFCQHLWDHYLFTGDRRFLADRAYPLMKGAAEFYLDWLVDGGKGRLVTPAGVSPENLFVYADQDGKQQSAGVSMGPTMDLAIIRELFTNCIQAGEVLGRDPEFRRVLKARLERLLPYQIGSRGQLLEWPRDFAERDPKHRHISHLYPLHPGNQISRRGQPQLFEAARRTLELRGDEGTGWSRAWKINFWSRMEDGNRAYKLVRNLLQAAKTGEGRYDRGGVMPNLFCSHPPFQIDGNFGGTAGIAEMLLQSHLGEVHMLPALPDAWPSGSVRGLCARGGFEVSIDWERGRLTGATIRSRLGHTCKVRYGEKTLSIPTEAGKSYRLNVSLEISIAP